jgi:hypothetical protein
MTTVATAVDAADVEEEEVAMITAAEADTTTTVVAAAAIMIVAGTGTAEEEEDAIMTGEMIEAGGESAVNGVDGVGMMTVAAAGIRLGDRWCKKYTCLRLNERLLFSSIF